MDILFIKNIYLTCLVANFEKFNLLRSLHFLTITAVSNPTVNNNTFSLSHTIYICVTDATMRVLHD